MLKSVTIIINISSTVGKKPRGKSKTSEGNNTTAENRR